MSTSEAGSTLGQHGASMPVSMAGRFNIQAHRICFQFPRRLSDIDSWHEHIPFAFFCASLLRPRIFVELGAFKGDSFCAFNQAMDEIGAPGMSYAVDTWAGDEHSGAYGDEVYNELKSYHDVLYGARSRLVRATFDEALEQFADSSIDLLHIDGLHTYEAVRHDFETWLPKMSERGVVLFHDVSVRERDFGVWRLWDEISARWNGFAFPHGNGLGILAVGSAVPPEFLDFIAQAKDPEQRIEEIFYLLGNRVSTMARLGRAESELAIYRHDIPIARDRIGAQDQELDQLRRGLIAGEGREINLRERLEQLSSEHQRLTIESRERIARLEEKQAELAGALDAIRASTSWRLTAPVRFGIRTLRGNLGRVRRRLRSLFSSRPGVTLRGLTKISWENDHYRAAGNPILFEVTPPNARMPTGWCRVAFGGASNRGPLMLALSAQQQNKVQTAFDLPPADGARVATLLRMPAQTIQLVLQVKGGPEIFSIERFEIRPLSKVEALLRLVWRKIAPHVRHPENFPSLMRAALVTLRRDGVSGLRGRLVRSAGVTNSSLHAAVVEAEPEILNLAYKPLISLIMPVYEIDPALLIKAVESVQAQLYDNWELCISDDASKRSDTKEALDHLAASERRIRLTRSDVNGGISAASNKALSLARGEFVAMIDHDDALTPDALQEYVRRLNDNPAIDIFYSDEDKIDLEGYRSEPFYKPDWSPILFCGVMYVGHLLMVRRSLVEEIGGFDRIYDGVQDFELMLRLSEKTDRIEHVRKILYHWRRIPGSLADSGDAKPEIGQKQAAAVTAHLQRLGIHATAQPHASLPHRVVLRPETRSDWPMVSIIIPTKDAPELIGRCLDTIFAKTAYRNFEVVVVDNGTTDPRALTALASHPVTLVRFDEIFNFSRANNLGAAQAKGEYLVLLNNDTEIVDGNWLQTLVSTMELPKVGAVGPLLLYPDRTVQHAGVALGLRGTADHVMRNFPANGDGYAGSLACAREVSAVTAASLMVRRETYEAIGGMKECYGTHYQDVDFCLRVRRAGYSILYTPATSLIHHESATRGDEYDHFDRALFKDAWDPVILSGDPYHSPSVPGYA